MVIIVGANSRERVDLVAARTKHKQPTMKDGRVQRSHGYDLRSGRHQECASSQVSKITESPAHVTDNIKS